MSMDGGWQSTSGFVLLASAACFAACAADTTDTADTSRCGEVNTVPGPTMRPGQNCLGCHQEGFGDPDAPMFSAAGTVFDAADSEHCDGVEGVKVFLTAADGSELELTTNEVGNFYTREPLMPEGPGPRLEFEDRTVKMGRKLPTVPACNACHDNPPLANAPGKIFAP